jgi:hypothetical protein
MAQTGFTPIQLYSSSTATNVPLAANLANGELAINITDGKLFYKDNASAVQVIGWKVVPATAGGTGQTSYAIGDLLYANTTTTLAKLPDVATGNALISGGVSTAPSWGKIGLATHVDGTLPILNGGTGQTSASAAFDALAPNQSGNNGKYLTTNGSTTSWGTVNSGASLSNDTTTATNLYPIFADATSGTPTTVYTSNAKLLYKPSTGELQASVPVASNGILVNSQTVAASYTIAPGYSGMSSGPVTVASGQAVTISPGSRWVVV